MYAKSGLICIIILFLASTLTTHGAIIHRNSDSLKTLRILGTRNDASNPTDPTSARNLTARIFTCSSLEDYPGFSTVLQRMNTSPDFPNRRVIPFGDMAFRDVRFRTVVPSTADTRVPKDRYSFRSINWRMQLSINAPALTWRLVLIAAECLDRYTKSLPTQGTSPPLYITISAAAGSPVAHGSFVPLIDDSGAGDEQVH